MLIAFLPTSKEHERTLSGRPSLVVAESSLVLEIRGKQVCCFGLMQVGRMRRIAENSGSLRPGPPLFRGTSFRDLFNA
jgi:hypothetical protein